jgi:hypothetical protein
MPGLEKMCAIFLYDSNLFFSFFSFVQFWAWKKYIFKKYTMLYVAMFGYGEGLARWICNHVWLWEKTITL